MRLFQLGPLLWIFLGSDSNRLRFPIDVRHRQRPERDQVNPRHKFGHERRQKFPMPAQQVNHHGGNAEIEYVVRGRDRAFDESWKDNDLQSVRNDGQYHRGPKARTGRDGDGIVSHVNKARRLNSFYAFYAMPPAMQGSSGFIGTSPFGAELQRRIVLMVKFLAAVLLAMIVLPLATRAEDLHALAAAVDEHYNHLRTLQAEFTEVYRGSGMERTESGTLWLAKGGRKKPGKMRWEYRSPKEKLFVSDGKDAWFYVPGDRQARRTDARKLDDVRSPLAFLLGKSKLEKELQGLSLAPDVAPLTAGDVVLRGVPQALAGRVSEILLEVTSEHTIVRILIDEVDGAVTEYRFSGETENQAISESRFHFTPPQGAETVESSLEP